MRPIRQIIAAFALVALASSTAEAVLPVSPSPEKTLCSGDYIFLGRVVSAVNEGLNQARLEVVVTKILGVRPDVAKNPELGMRVGQKIPALTSIDRSSADIGKEFLFSGGPGYVVMWPPAPISWAQEAMRQGKGHSGPGSCPAPL
jgi:hypothetical protein